jgi:hypothetical protein
MTWEIVDNPAYAGQTPRRLRAACHDRSPFLTIRCDCGFDMHLHETQLRSLPADAVIGMPCKGCRELLTFTPGHLQGAFARMRDAGWIE